jgi:hypothetical protein
MTAADAPINTILIPFLNRRTHGRILGELRAKLILSGMGEYQESRSLSLFINISVQIFPYKKCRVSYSEELMSFLYSNAKCWLGGYLTIR